MVKEKVLTGRYKDCDFVYDHIRSMNGEDIFFNSFSVMNMEPADKSKVTYWSDKSLRVDGTMAAEGEKDLRFLSIQWRNGEESLLQVNTKTFNRLMEAMYGRAPQEAVEEPDFAEKKSSKKVVFFIAVILICVALKFVVFN
jgi:hypothetical protein